MCGLYGIISNDPIKLKQINHAECVDLMSHRGPDDRGLLMDKNIVLGHRRLSIIDTGHSIQPMESISGNNIIVFNGEIYNFPKLRARLLEKGIKLRTQGDTEVLLEYCVAFGLNQTLKDIEGMYAFAIWDKTTKKLSLARDRIGEKFLYYSSIGDTIIFASEIKSILKTKLIKPEVNKHGLFEYFCRSKVSGANTLFKNIFELPPGTFVELELGKDYPNKLKPKTYWDLIGDFKESRISKNIDVQDVETILIDSVASRMISDVPVGILASGGLDSSYLIGELAHLGFKGLTGYCAGNFSKELDESPFAEKQINFVNTNFASSFKLDVTKKNEELLREIALDLTFKHDEPLIYLNSLQLFEVCKKAKSDGVKVLISGEGSDEIFCGYHRHINFLKYIKTKQIESTDDEILDTLYFGGGSATRQVVEKLLGLAEDYSDEIRGDAWLWLQQNKSIAPEDLVFLFDQKHRLETLLHRQDRIGMSASIELRQPYLNYELFNAANGLTVGQRYDYKNDNPKAILKKYSEKLIDPSIIAREKTGFPSDMEKWFNSDAGISEIKNLCNSEDSICKKHLDINYLNTVFEKQRSGADAGKFNFLMQKLYFLELWKKSWNYLN